MRPPVERRPPAYLQKVVTRPAARAFRVRDGKEVRQTMLFRAGDNTLGRAHRRLVSRRTLGQLAFTHEGDDYYVQYLPVGMQELDCPPELMLAQMTVAGVDHFILQAGGGYGAMNDYNAFAQHQHPGKFTGLLNIDEATADRPETLAEVDRAVRELGLRGLYYAHDFPATATPQRRPRRLPPVLGQGGGLRTAGVHRAVVDAGLRSRGISSATWRRSRRCSRLPRSPLPAGDGTAGRPLRHRPGRWEFPRGGVRDLQPRQPA